MSENGFTGIKRFTSGLYESGPMNEAMGDTFRPGGLALTERVAELAGLHSGSLALEVACGKGATSCFLSEKYGCRILGLDLSLKLIKLAQKRVLNSGSLINVDVLIGDSELLPFKNSVFDAVISECSVSLLPDKHGAAEEIKRVLKPEGKLVISDVILRSEINNRLKNQITFASCISGAESVEGYIRLFEDVGFEDTYVEDHSEELKRLAWQILLRFGSFENFSRKLLQDSSISETGCCVASSKNVRQALRQAKPGYAVFSFTNPK
ncbi:MAG: DVU_1556 family methyltransferase [Syntrophales bacterium]